MCKSLACRGGQPVYFSTHETFYHSTHPHSLGSGCSLGCIHAARKRVRRALIAPVTRDPHQSACPPPSGQAYFFETSPKEKKRPGSSRRFVFLADSKTGVFGLNRCGLFLGLAPSGKAQTTQCGPQHQNRRRQWHGSHLKTVNRKPVIQFEGAATRYGVISQHDIGG